TGARVPGIVEPPPLDGEPEEARHAEGLHLGGTLLQVPPDRLRAVVDAKDDLEAGPPPRRLQGRSGPSLAPPGAEPRTAPRVLPQRAQHLFVVVALVGFLPTPLTGGPGELIEPPQHHRLHLGVHPPGFRRLGRRRPKLP